MSMMSFLRIQSSNYITEVKKQEKMLIQSRNKKGKEWNKQKNLEKSADLKN